MEDKEKLLVSNREQVLTREMEKKQIGNYLETLDTSILYLAKLNAEREHVFEAEYQYVSGGRYQHKFEQKTSHYSELMIFLKQKMNQSIETLEEKQVELAKEIQTLEAENQQLRKELVGSDD